MNNKASAFQEYAVIIGVVAAALIAMQTYIQLNLQGKTKEVTDALIGPAPMVSSSTSGGDSFSRTDRSSSQSIVFKDGYIDIDEKQAVSSSATSSAAYPGAAGDDSRSSGASSADAGISDRSQPLSPGVEGFIKKGIRTDENFLYRPEFSSDSVEGVTRDAGYQVPQ